MTHALALPRRRFLAALPAAPFAVIALPAPASAADHPDAALLRLGAEHARLSERMAAVSQVCGEAIDRADDDWPALPDVLRIRHDDWFKGWRGPGSYHDGESVARWSAAIPSPGPGVHCSASTVRRFNARGHELAEAWNAHLARIEAVYTAHGVREAEALLDAAGQELTAAEHRIFNLRALTPDGWRLKARIAAGVMGPEPDGTYEDQLARSLIADLAGGPAFTPRG
jgi:hypothetical protein